MSTSKKYTITENDSFADIIKRVAEGIESGDNSEGFKGFLNTVYGQFGRERVANELESTFGLGEDRVGDYLQQVLLDPKSKERSADYKKIAEVGESLGLAAKFGGSFIDARRARKDERQAKEDLKSSVAPATPRMIGQDPAIQAGLRRARELGSPVGLKRPAKDAIQSGFLAGKQAIQDVGGGQSSAVNQNLQALALQRMQQEAGLANLPREAQAMALQAEQPYIGMDLQRKMSNQGTQSYAFQILMDKYLKEQEAAGTALGNARARKDFAWKGIFQGAPELGSYIQEKIYNSKYTGNSNFPELNQYMDKLGING